MSDGTTRRRLKQQRTRRILKPMAMVCVGFGGLGLAQDAAAQDAVAQDAVAQDAVAPQTELAYYVSDPDDAGTEIEMVVAETTVQPNIQSILLANLLQEPPVPAPLPNFDAIDAPIESSSDILVDDAFPPAPVDGDEELGGTGQIVDAEDGSETEPDAAQELVPTPVDPMPFTPRPAPAASIPEPVFQDDVIVDDMLVPAPLEAPFREANMVPANRSTTLTQRRPSLGATAAAYSSAPNMIGDHFGGTLLFGTGNHTISSAGGDRRFKIAENVSPMPQDRVFFNYNHFENALRDLNNVNRSLDRFTFGFEKTLFDGHASLELRLPIADGLDSLQSFGVADTTSTEFGNLGMAIKVNLLSGCNWILSGGTTISIPTGDDFRVLNGNVPDLLVRNDAVHLAPFIGYLNQLSDKWFFQGFIQADFDLEGNKVYTVAGGYEGIVQDQNLLFMDASIGRWLCRRCDPCARLTGVAAIAELHYTSTMNDTDTVSGITNPYNRMDVLNASGALNFQLRQTSVRVGAAAPLREVEERLFDAEIIFQLNRQF